MAIDPKRFYFRGAHKPYRHRDDFVEWRRKMAQQGKLGPHGAVPYLNPDIPDDKFNPYLVKFPSVRALVEYSRAIPGLATADCDEWGHHNEEQLLRSYFFDKPFSWCWGFNTNDTFALYDRGWTEGISAINDRIEATATAAMIAAMKEVSPVRDLHGAFIDIDAFVQGDPECMFEFQDIVTPQLHITIEVDGFVQANVNPDDMLMRGVAICSAIMALRRVGVFVTAYVNDKGTPARNHTHGITEFQFQIMNQNLTENLSETLMALCHPAFRRTILFHAYSAFNANNDGGTMRLSRDSDEYIPVPGSAKIVIPGQFWDRVEKLDDCGIDWHNSWASPKAAEDLVKLLFQCAAPR